MGTFHHHKGSLHGMTVVVETAGAKVFVGRCDAEAEQGIVLLDVDVHEDGENGRSKEEFLRQVTRVGHWSRHERIEVATAEIRSVTRLGDISVD